MTRRCKALVKTRGMKPCRAPAKSGGYCGHHAPAQRDAMSATDREIVRVVRETMLPIGRDFSMSAMTDQLEELLTKEGEGTR